MARELPIDGRFGYRRVQLLKNEDNSLGIGSYGAVYKARCDQLPCAAKILHPILFSTRDPASRRIIERFEQECEFLSGMRHPNIIQYLGTCRDPESRLPVLLMELMDESLTSFLERPDDPPSLPFYVQVNISLDIAQALAYLHSNEVLHRDLSSNNVLLIGSSRAKVTDFGMAKLAGDHTRLTPTFCPGTMAYMSPEALREPPAYTTKLDTFSCGVLQIQILTRKFPNPGPRFNQVEISDPRFSLGRVEVPVPERERRKSHIDLIDPTHPLLRIALDCLKDKEGERPSAEQLCSYLAALKEAPRYQESLQRAQQAGQSLHKETDAQPEFQRERSQRNQELQQQLEEREETVKLKKREVDSLVKNMEQLRLQSERQMQENRQKEMQIQQYQTEIQQLRHELHQSSQESEELVVTMQQSLERKDEVIRSKDAALQEKERRIRELQGDKRKKSTNTPPLKLQWSSGPKAPLEASGDSSAVHGKVAYFYSFEERTIMMYNSETVKWATLPDCPKTHFSISVVNGLLTAIGGAHSQDSNPTKTLLSFKTSSSLFGLKKWMEVFPPMTYHHVSPAVACTSSSLIVAGGHGQQVTVEVMDTKTLHWSTAASLPCPWAQATVTICGDRMYMAGGVMEDVKTNKVLTCVMSELLQSSASSHNVWREVTPLPVTWSSLVTFHGQLLAIGGCGCGSDWSLTSAVRQYDAATNTWKIVSHMSTKKCQCYVAVVPDNTLVVAGGVVKPHIPGQQIGKATDSVAFASSV